MTEQPEQLVIPFTTTVAEIFLHILICDKVAEDLGLLSDYDTSVFVCDSWAGP